MISFGSLDDVVFMLHVNLSDRGFISSVSLIVLLIGKTLTNVHSKSKVTVEWLTSSQHVVKQDCLMVHKHHL